MGESNADRPASDSFPSQLAVTSRFAFEKLLSVVYTMVVRSFCTADERDRAALRYILHFHSISSAGLLSL